MYYYIEPEVSGGIGKNSIIDTSSHPPPKVIKLNYEFDGWLGDDLVESFPCFIVTEALKTHLESENLNGYTFDDVEVTKSETFNDLHPYVTLPKFYWLQISERAGQGDFGIADDFRLVISGKTLALLRSHKVDHADIEEFK